MTQALTLGLDGALLPLREMSPSAVAESENRLHLCVVQAGATGRRAEHVTGAGTQGKAGSPRRTEEAGGVDGGPHRCAKVRGLPFSCDWKRADGNNETC